MATTKAGGGRTRAASPAPGASRRVGAFALSFLLVLAGLALAAAAALFAFAGVWQLLDPSYAGGAVGSVVVVAMGLAGVAVAGWIVFWSVAVAASAISGRPRRRRRKGRSSGGPAGPFGGGYFGGGDGGGGCGGGDGGGGGSC